MSSNLPCIFKLTNKKEDTGEGGRSSGVTLRSHGILFWGPALVPAVAPTVDELSFLTTAGLFALEVGGCRKLWLREVEEDEVDETRMLWFSLLLTVFNQSKM